MQTPPVDFLDVEAVAKRLGISASALHKHRCNGSGPPYCKVGARVLYRWADVINWVENRKASSVAAHRDLAGKHRPALSKRPAASESAT